MANIISNLFSRSIMVKGKVFNNSDNKPLAGASVTTPDKKESTATDTNGEFTIKISSSTKELIFSYPGMKEHAQKIEEIMIIHLHPETKDEPAKDDAPAAKQEDKPAQDDKAKDDKPAAKPEDKPAKDDTAKDDTPAAKQEDKPAQDDKAKDDTPAAKPVDEPAKDDKAKDDTPAAKPVDEPTKDDKAKDDTPAAKPEDEPAKDDKAKDDTPAAKPEDEPKEEDDELEPVIDLEKPEVRLTTSINDKENGMVIGMSIQGRSHISHGIPCQDYHAYELLAPGWRLAITSDGAGSARAAARGSKANCELAVRMIKQLITSKKWVENNYFPTELEWYIEIRNILEYMQETISKKAKEQASAYKTGNETELAECEEALKTAKNDRKKSKLLAKISELKQNIEKPLEARDFNATIIIFLLTPQGMLTAHIGDGRMGYLSQDGEWKPLLTPHKGDEASSTVFVPNAWNQLRIPAFTMSDAYLPEVHAIKELPKAYVLMSDGCEDFTWQCYAHDKENNRYYDPNRPFDKFFNPLITAMKEEEDNDKRVADLIDIINTVGKHEQDDRTILFGILE